MFCWPDRLKPDVRRESISSIDIQPTVMAACGITPDPALPGIDLLSSMEKREQIDREAIFGEGFAHDMADIDDPEKTLLYRWCIEGKMEADPDV